MARLRFPGTPPSCSTGKPAQHGRRHMGGYVAVTGRMVGKDPMKIMRRAELRAHTGQKWQLGDLRGGHRRLRPFAAVVAVLAAFGVPAVSQSGALASAQTLTWAIVPSPNVPNSGNFLNAVSCASARFCVAVGAHVGKAQGAVSHPLIETWNGTRWSIAAAPSVPRGELFGVSCPSATACAAVGFTTPPGGGNSSTLAERWDGTQWSVVPSPNRLDAQ